MTTNAYIYKEIGRLAYLLGVNERLFSILYPEIYSEQANDRTVIRLVKYATISKGPSMLFSHQHT